MASTEIKTLTLDGNTYNLNDTTARASIANLASVASSGSYNDLSNKPTIPNKTSQLTNDSGFVNTDTKNTAGASDVTAKLFIIGATSQGQNPQTYSQDTAYIGADGCLYSDGTKVLTSHQDISGKQDTLVSGTNIKTINGTSLLGSGNITISGSSGGEANVIETVKVNGTALVPDSNKAVDVIVPTKTSDLTNDSTFVTSSDVSQRLLLKQDTITGGATTIASDNLTAGRALVSNSNGKVAVSDVTSTELGYLDGVTSSIQTQLNAKASASSLATVATSGSYDDLTNKPTIPSAYTLPQATGSSLGGIKANNKSNADTIPCNIDPSTGLLYVQPSSNMEYTYSSPSPVTVSNSSGQSASFSSIRQYKRFLASVSAFSLVINNSLAGENMILIENTGSSDCVVTISDLLYQNVSVDIAYVPASISIEAGESIVLEYETFNEYTTTIGIVTMSSPISNTSNS